MDYNTPLASLTISQIDAIVRAAQVAANRAHHGSCCQGWLSYCVNAEGERISYDKIPAGEHHKWWQAFDASKCSCGLQPLRSMLWDRRLSEAYLKKEIKRLEGYGAHSDESKNVISLQVEVDVLRNEVVLAREDAAAAREESAKLSRKLDAAEKALRRIA